MRRRAVDGIVLLDKPLGYSSNQALQQVKALFRAEKAGHTGSLDPLASGLLPICLGHATKLSGYLLDGNKRYIAEVQLGQQTSTADAEGQVIAESDASGVTEDQILALIPGFHGPQFQVPPMHSAIKVQGQALYHLAREGQVVERAPRHVVIESLQLLRYDPDARVVELEVYCSKGTYIRSLAEDLAAALHQKGHLKRLRRIGADPFLAPQMISLESLTGAAEESAEALDRHLLPLLSALQGWPVQSVDDEEMQLLSRGIAVTARLVVDEKTGVAVVDEHNRLLGLAQVSPDGQLHPKRWMTPQR